MTPAILKNLMSILLVATGVLHIVVAAVGAPPQLQVPLSLFGALFSALGVFVRSGGRTLVIASIIAAAAGLAAGGSHYLREGGPISLPVMLLIDIAIIGAGGLWLLRTGRN